MYIRRPCGCRCVQYSILGGKAQGVRAIFLRQWIFSFLVGQGRVIPRPAGASPLAEPVDLAAAVPGGGLALFVACQPCLWLALLPPSPRPALAERSSRREGGDQGYFMQGASPLASPALDRLRHLQSLLSRCPAGGCSPCGTCSPCPGGEDHLKRRSSSPPVPPLLGWRHCPEDRISVGFASNWRRRRLTPRSNTGLAGRASAARVQPRECKGRSPLHENNLSPPPFPPGRGSGG